MSLEEELQHQTDELIIGWLGTASSQIFFMQLGFLCYEVGYVKQVWTPSVILKNIEDTFVGLLVYLSFTHTLATSSPSLFGLISVPNQLFLINVDPEHHPHVFVSAVFATTCATIISGSVLERMKNKAYLAWCFLTILVNYSVIAHWIWHPNGWLSNLGFMDGAGAAVIHSTGGVASAIAVWKLGPRRNAVEKDGTLKPIERATRPIIHGIGAFILWFGWFAFNISSAAIANFNVNDAHVIGTAALVTMLGPSFACFSGLLLMYRGFLPFRFENLMSCMLAGLVSITGSCFTIGIWEASCVGFFASFAYFITAWVVRNKLKLDDPLQIIPVHLCCGLYSCLCEGIFANNEMGNPGLIFSGFKHFGVQILGTIACLAFNVVIGLLLWNVVMEKCFFRHTNIKVSILDTYVGVHLFKLDNVMALEEVLLCKTNLARQMALIMHQYTLDRFNNEQFDFLLAITTFRDFANENKNEPQNIVKAIISIIETYILSDAEMCINISSPQRSQWMRIYNKLQSQTQMKDQLEVVGGLESVFDDCYVEVITMIVPVFGNFLKQFEQKRDTTKDCVALPFVIPEITWFVQWKEKHTPHDVWTIDNLSKYAIKKGTPTITLPVSPVSVTTSAGKKEYLSKGNLSLLTTFVIH